MIDDIYQIEASDDTPFFIFDRKKSIIKIIGISMPENAFEFYDPIEKMLLDNVKGNVTFEVELTYMNSMSNKQILKLIKFLAAKIEKLNVVWKYTKDDELIKLKGEEIQQICNGVEVKLVETT